MTHSGDAQDGDGNAPLARLARELRQLAERGEAVLLFGEDATLLWSTTPGAVLLGASSPTDLEGRIPDPDLFPVERISELATHAAPLAGTRLERLRVLVGRRSEVLTLACRRIVLHGGRSLLLAVAMGRRPTLVGGPAASVSLPAFLAPPPPPPPPPAAPQAPEPTTIEALRARAGRPAIRVLWRTDEAGRFTAISPEVDELLGPGAAPALGETMQDAAAHGVVDEEDLLAAALVGRDTFTGLSVLCPVAGGESYLPVVMSGVPVFTSDRRFEGFRGFGVSRLEMLSPPPPGARARTIPQPSGPTQVAPGSAASPGHTPSDMPAPAGGTPPDRREAEPPGKTAAVIPFAPMQGSAHGQLAATNVVPLKAAPRVTPGKPIPPSLSRTERNAFREIARALGARMEGDEDVSSLKSPPGGEAEPPVDADEPSSDFTTSVDTKEQDAVVAELPDAEEVDPASDTPIAETFPEVGVPAEAEPADVQDVISSAPEPEDRLADQELQQDVAESRALDVPAEPAGPPPALPVPAPAESAPVVEPAPVTEPVLVADPIGLAANAETVFDRLPIGMLVSRGDVPIIMNRTLLDLLGYGSIDEFHADGGLPHLFRPAAGAEPMESGRLTIATRSGEALAVEARLQTIQWSGLPATLVTFRRSADPEQEREVKAAQTQLARRDRETRELRAILDTATDGVIVIGEDGRILSINRSGEALFGYDQSEIEGETFITLFAPDSHATALDYLEGLRSNGVASVLNDGREVIGRVRQGGRIPLFMTLGSISEAPERKFCAVLRDITPWKKAETDLTEAKRAAEEASAQKSDFLAKISHEIRTPLSAIIGFAEVMIEERFGPIGNERYLEYLRDIHASGGHVISLVNDLLDLSKIEAGRFDLTFVSVDVNEIVTRAVALMQPQAGTGRVVVRTALASRLPRVVADERSLRQIVLNLLSNGIKFTDPGGQVIVSTALTDRGEVAVRIRDTGIGMTDKEIETALEPFRQIATARRAGGTGLGLPLTKALVEANRASLNIRSQPESGTLVEVTFPTTRVLAE